MLACLGVDPLDKVAQGDVERRLALFLGRVEVVVADRAPGEVVIVFDAVQRRHPVALPAGILTQSHVVALGSKQVSPCLFQEARLRGRSQRRGDRIEAFRCQKQRLHFAIEDSQLVATQSPGERLVPGVHRQVNRFLGIRPVLVEVLLAGDELDRRFLGELLVLRRGGEIRGVLGRLPAEFLPGEDQRLAQPLELLECGGRSELLQVGRVAEQRVLGDRRNGRTVDPFPGNRVELLDWTARPAPRIHLGQAGIAEAGPGDDLRDLRMGELLFLEEGGHLVVQRLADRLPPDHDLPDVRLPAEHRPHRLAIAAADQFHLPFGKVLLEPLGNFRELLGHELVRSGIEVDAGLDVRRAIGHSHRIGHGQDA